MADAPTGARLCANCKTPLQGEYCHRCGQRDKDYLRNVFGLVADFLQEVSEWDSRFWRSLVPLLFRPGHLSSEWVAGRRVHYVSPVRLYIFISIAFFLVFATVAEFNDGLQFTPSQESVAEGVDPRGELDEGDIRVDLPWISEEERARIKAQVLKLSREPKLAVRQAMSLAPQMMFLLLPVFAFVLKVFYLFSRRYYTEHLLLAVHTHAFLYLAFLILIGLDSLSDWAAGSTVAASVVGLPTTVLTTALWFWMPVYLFLAQKRFYGQGWTMTTVKYLLTGTTYFFMMVFGLAGLMIATILTA